MSEQNTRWRTCNSVKQIIVAHEAPKNLVEVIVTRKTNLCVRLAKRSP